MVIKEKYNNINIALIIMGAIFIYSCNSGMQGDIIITDKEKIPTITTKNHSITFNEEGKKKYQFKTKLMERYEMVEEPYMEFRKGIKIETYDSLMKVKTHLTANYAIFNETKKLWEAKGNVIGSNVDGDQIHTEQIFWDQSKDSVYSNVQTKIIRGDEISIGAGFKSGSDLKNIEFWQTKGRMYFDTTKTVIDSLSVDSTKIDTDSLNIK